MVRFIFCFFFVFYVEGDRSCWVRKRGCICDIVMVVFRYGSCGVVVESEVFGMFFVVGWCLDVD